MSCRQASKNHADAHTMVNATKLDNIGSLYGHNIANELLEVSHNTSQVGGGFKAEGYITNANYSNKRFTMILFINNRLVETT